MTFLLPSGVSLAPGGLRLLLRFIQRRTGVPPWGGVVADEFRAPRGTLLIVRPALSASIAPYALPFIHKYFKL